MSESFSYKSIYHLKKTCVVCAESKDFNNNDKQTFGIILEFANVTDWLDEFVRERLESLQEEWISSMKCMPKGPIRPCRFTNNNKEWAGKWVSASKVSEQRRIVLYPDSTSYYSDMPQTITEIQHSIREKESLGFKSIGLSPISVMILALGALLAIICTREKERWLYC